MQTITLEIKDPKTMQDLEQAARQRGKRPEDFILELLEVELLADKPFEEIVAPLEASFDESGMTEEELDELIKRERQAIWEKAHDLRNWTSASHPNAAGVNPQQLTASLTWMIVHSNAAGVNPQ